VAANRSRERFAIDPDFSVQERSEPQIMALQEGRELVALRSIVRHRIQLRLQLRRDHAGSLPWYGVPVVARSLFAEPL